MKETNRTTTDIYETKETDRQSSCMRIKGPGT